MTIFQKENYYIAPVIVCEAERVEEVKKSRRERFCFFDPSGRKIVEEKKGRSAMARSTSKDAQALFQSLRSAYAATPTNLKVNPFSLSLKSELNSWFFFFHPFSSPADHRSLCGFCCPHSCNPGTLSDFVLKNEFCVVGLLWFMT